MVIFFKLVSLIQYIFFFYRGRLNIGLITGTLQLTSEVPPAVRWEVWGKPPCLWGVSWIPPEVWPPLPHPLHHGHAVGTQCQQNINSLSVSYWSKNLIMEFITFSACMHVIFFWKGVCLQNISYSNVLKHVIPLNFIIDKSNWHLYFTHLKINMCKNHIIYLLCLQKNT